MMRVLLICGAFPPMKCGVGDYTAMLAHSLARLEGIDVGVLTDAAAVASYDASLEVFPLITEWKLSELPKLLKAVKDWQPDIVHVQYPAVNYGKKPMPHWLPFIFRIQGTIVVQTWHEPYDVGMCFHNLPNALTRDALIIVEPDYKMMVPGWFRRIIDRKRFQFISVGSSIPKIALSETERSNVKSVFDSQECNLIVYFGFASPAKGIEYLFEVTDPALDRLVLICDLDARNLYHKKIIDLVCSEPWMGKAFVTGFITPEEVGRILSAADAALYPFLNGVAWRNTSVLAARAQGTFVVTTARERHGYDADENCFYSGLGDYAEMMVGLRRHVGQRTNVNARQAADWEEIANAHIRLYMETLR
jgi:glycosyltransferase involved in cell wall biosynthesis